MTGDEIGGNPLEKLYIALDIETTGNRIGKDSMLSLGAVVVTRVAQSFTEKRKLGLTFYVEMKPTSLAYIPAAVAVGASNLSALGPVWNKPLLIPGHSACNEAEMLRYLQDSESTVPPATAMRRFAAWVQKAAYLKDAEGVIDTAFFDSGFFNYYCTEHGGFRPLFGWSGLDLRSFWAGVTGNPSASLKTARDAGKRPLKHHAGDDAYDLAETARVILYEKLGYEKLPNR